ncbi:MAG: hypothetical protein EAZ53_11600 [Bacteroidetes bacterium]|nr:MAG: hypothetical protein EAZ53_11600 [Bacteroidota bacterium]
MSSYIFLKLLTPELRTDSKAAANKGFAIAGVPCFADTLVQGGSSVLRIKFSANKPRHRQAANRIGYSKPKKQNN